MDRREFLAMSGAAGAAALGLFGGVARAAEASARDYYELRAYEVTSEEQRKAFETFMTEAAIPALNRLDISPIGVFLPAEELSPIRILLRHRSLESVVITRQKLYADAEFLVKGADHLNAPASSPAYARMECSLLIAFSGMPQLETPVKGAGRVFQLRTYESPSVKTGKKKIEMFNTAELAIFRKTGLTPVFFGEMLIGAKMPNLTYMLGFESMEEQEAAWKRFREDPDWLALRAKPDYSDKAILCGITNHFLKPSACSQI